jgi:hypothetical protein
MSLRERERLKRLFQRAKARDDQAVTWTWEQSYRAGAFARRLGVWSMRHRLEPSVNRDAWGWGWEDEDRIINDGNGVLE